MEFLLVGESKLKIVMNESEMKRYKLDSHGTDSGATSRRAFWRVLDMAKTEVGFDPAGDKVLIQFYPIKTGGCEVFVTKLGILPAPSARLVSKSDRISMLSKHCSFYSFDGLDTLLDAIRAVARASDGELPRADVYYLGGEIYFLSIEEYAKGGEPAEFPCILEFGKGLTADFSVYISEHCRRLTNGDAIEKFSLF